MLGESASYWKNLITSNGLLIDESQIRKMDSYTKLLVEWNTKINLVSRKDEANIWPNHIMHSISLLFAFDILAGTKVADIGSGGGLPGIPLAIMLPKVEVVLIDSIKKKCVALDDILRRLEIRNARVVNSRVEEISKTKTYGGRFDIVTARAVAPLNDLISWSRPLMKRGLTVERKVHDGTVEKETLRCPLLIAMKGGDIDEEIEVARKSFRWRELLKLDVQFRGIQHTGLVDKKMVIIGI